MTTVVARVAVSTAVVTLDINHTVTLLGVERADINGTKPVRTRGIFPRTGAGSLSIPDYEAALTGLLEYRVKTSSGVVVVRTTLDSSKKQLPRFILPMVPNYSVAVETVHEYDERRDTGATLHEVIGRSDPLVVLGKLRSRRGRLKIWADTYRDMAKLRALLFRGETVLYRQVEHQGMDMYFIPLSYQVSPAGGDWEMDVEYVQVAFPTLDIISYAGWTFAALASQGASFSRVADEYENFTQLEMGVKK